ncbi:hypothetical protein HFP66_30365 [Bacillus sp. A17A.1]
MFDKLFNKIAGGKEEMPCYDPGCPCGYVSVCVPDPIYGTYCTCNWYGWG